MKKSNDPKHPPPEQIDAPEKRQRGIQSVDQAIDLLGVFEAAAGPMSLKALAEKSGMPMSSTHRYLVSLRRTGLVNQDEATGLYDLGPMALHLGLASMRRMDALGVTERAARRVAALSKQTVFVSIWTNEGPVIVRWFSGERIIMTTAGIGAVLPIFSSSTGRVFAAYMQEWTARDLMKKQTKYSAKALTGILAGIRDAGYAWIDQLMMPGLYAVAAPVRDMQGGVAATITLLSTEASLVKLPNASLRCLLEETGEASRQIGFQEGH
jgi:DNA-binding IclR family transcriptional regulator